MSEFSKRFFCVLCCVSHFVPMQLKKTPMKVSEDKADDVWNITTGYKVV